MIGSSNPPSDLVITLPGVGDEDVAYDYCDLACGKRVAESLAIVRKLERIQEQREKTQPSRWSRCDEPLGCMRRVRSHPHIGVLQQRTNKSKCSLRSQSKYLRMPRAGDQRVAHVDGPVSGCESHYPLQTLFIDLEHLSMRCDDPACSSNRDVLPQGMKGELQCHLCGRSVLALEDASEASR